MARSTASNRFLIVAANFLNGVSLQRLAQLGYATKSLAACSTRLCCRARAWTARGAKGNFNA
jgi:hypothetical protein